MKRIEKEKIVVLLFTAIICCIFVGCGKTTNYSKNDGMFVGVYSPDDYWDDGEDENAKMEIKFDGESYMIELSLTKFGKFSCVGEKDDDCLSFTGANDDGEIVYGNIEYEEGGIVEFELWNDDYLLFEDEEDFLEIYFQKE